MTNPITKVALNQTAAVPPAKAPAIPPAKDARTQKLEKAAGEFESLFVKQLLKEAKIGGDQKNGGYADMAVDALANGIQRGGGLGLAKRIEQALNLAHAHVLPATAGGAAAQASHVAPSTPQPATRSAKR